MNLDGNAICSLIIGGGLSAAGAAMIGSSGAKCWLAFASRRWPRTRAVIVRTDLVEIPMEDGVSFQVVVEYIYEVGDAEYRNTNLAFVADQQFAEREPAQRFANRFPVQAEFQVAYNPREPAQSVLQPGFESPGFPILILGLGFLLVLGGGLMIWSAVFLGPASGAEQALNRYFQQ